MTNPPLPEPGPHLTEDQLEQALAFARMRLKQAGLRITKPRLDILSVLYRTANPMSIEAIHEALPKRSCDLVTVYRCLAAFEDVGLVQKCFANNGTCLFESRLGNRNHIYVVCRTTGKVDKIPLGSVEHLLQPVLERGYRNIMLLVEAFGVSKNAADKPPEI